MGCSACGGATPKADHALRAEYGLLPGVWEPDASGRVGASDGAGFAAALRRADGTEEVLSSTFLDPVRVDADRSIHFLDAQFETGPGCDLILRTKVGPLGDAERDWTWWRRVVLDGRR